MSDLLSAAYDMFGHCLKCGSGDVTPYTEAFHISGECMKPKATTNPERPTPARLEEIRAFAERDRFQKLNLDLLQKQRDWWKDEKKLEARVARLEAALRPFALAHSGRLPDLPKALADAAAALGETQ